MVPARDVGLLGGAGGGGEGGEGFVGGGVAADAEEAGALLVVAFFGRYFGGGRWRAAGWGDVEKGWEA